jgi:hypothetical protein
MGDRDILFMTKNCFFTGAYNNAINEASDLEGLSDAEQTEKDALVYRSYIALGSHDVGARCRPARAHRRCSQAVGLSASGGRLWGARMARDAAARRAPATRAPLLPAPCSW